MKPTFFAFLACFLLFSAFNPPAGEPEEGIFFRFQGKNFELRERVRVLAEDCWGGWCQTNDELDTLCNVFLESKNRVKIIRQDDGFAPEFGIGLLFSFNPVTDSLPVLVETARLQFNDFRFGGLRASQSDRANFTGVTNSVSSDLKLTIERFDGEFIEGIFSGVLVNGAGGMAPIEEGQFRIRLFRMKI